MSEMNIVNQEMVYLTMMAEMPHGKTVGVMPLDGAKPKFQF